MCTVRRNQLYKRRSEWRIGYTYYTMYILSGAPSIGSKNLLLVTSQSFSFWKKTFFQFLGALIFWIFLTINVHFIKILLNKQISFVLKVVRIIFTPINTPPKSETQKWAYWTFFGGNHVVNCSKLLVKKFCNWLFTLTSSSLSPFSLLVQ